MAEFNRRHNIKGASSSGAPQRWEAHEAASVDDNVFYEQTCAQPNYQYSRLIGASTTDVNPIVAEPVQGDRWNLNGFYGLNGYVELVSIASVDISLWCLDEFNAKWFKVATASSLGSREAFDFRNMARNRICFVQCATATGGGETVTIFATGE